MQAAIWFGNRISPGGWQEKEAEREQQWTVSTKAEGLRQNFSELIHAGDGVSRALCAVEGGAASYDCTKPAAHDLVFLFVFTSC